MTFASRSAALTTRPLEKLRGNFKPNLFCLWALVLKNKQHLSSQTHNYMTKRLMSCSWLLSKTRPSCSTPSWLRTRATGLGQIADRAPHHRARNLARRSNHKNGSINFHFLSWFFILLTLKTISCFVAFFAHPNWAINSWWNGSLCYLIIKKLYLALIGFEMMNLGLDSRPDPDLDSD